jgi:carboxylesterase type B
VHPTSFPATYRGGVIPEDPAVQPATGEVADVPVMHGLTRDEHVTFQAGIDPMMGPVAPADYPAVLGQFLGVDAATADRVAREYPLSDHAGSTSRARASVLTDRGWGCPATNSATPADLGDYEVRGRGCAARTRDQRHPTVSVNATTSRPSGSSSWRGPVTAVSIGTG